MTMRCGTSRSIVLALRLGHGLEDAVKLAVEELAELKTGFLAGVVIHAMDAKGNHQVVNYRCDEEIRYWYWDERMSAPELRVASILQP
jgi:L-asparaginase